MVLFVPFAGPAIDTSGAGAGGLAPAGHGVKTPPVDEPSLLVAGLVDHLQLTIFPALSGRTGVEPVFQGVGDFDLEPIEHHTFDGRTQELTYRPTPRPR
jgi:hypothetical protein